MRNPVTCDPCVTAPDTDDGQTWTVMSNPVPNQSSLLMCCMFESQPSRRHSHKTVASVTHLIVQMTIPIRSLPVVSIIALVASAQLCQVSGFAPTSSVATNFLGSTDSRQWTLEAARRGGSVGGSPKNKKNAGPGAGPKSRKKGNNKSKGGNDQPTSQRSRASQMNKKKPQSSNAPPWQVVSKKDMTKNVKAEKERRKLAQEEGIHNVKEDLNLKVSKTFLSNEDKTLLAWKRFAQSQQDEIDFIGAYLDYQLPPKLGAPEVAFLGRSNVGKSSLLNKLVGSETARVGKTPGATASVNLYGMFRKNKAILGLVDLPGFGYAKLSKESKESVRQAAENYLGKRRELMLGILLVDIRRDPSDDDRAVLAAMFDIGVPIIVVATKVDKLSKTQLDDSLTTIQEGLGLPEGQPFCVSSMTGEGIKDLWRIIMEVCESGVAEFKAKVEEGKLDEAGPESLPFADEDDIAYNQGFDWVHDNSSVMYEGDEGDAFYYEDEMEGEEGFYYEEEEEEEDIESMKKQSMKYLRQKAKDMERRGEL